MCDKRVSARMKGKVYKTVVRPAMLYGLETVALRKRQEAELEVAETKMLRFSLGVTRMDRIRNEYIRGTAHVRCFGCKCHQQIVNFAVWRFVRKLQRWSGCFLSDEDVGSLKTEAATQDGDRLFLPDSLSQFFQYDCVWLSCEPLQNSSGVWTVRRNTSVHSSSPCGDWGIQDPASCQIQNVYPSDSGVYWCQSERGEHSNAVNITVVRPLTNAGAVILESPPLPVPEGDNVTLFCHYQEKDKRASSGFSAHFFKDGVFIGTWPAGKMILTGVTTSDEGLYKCEHATHEKESPESWLAVRANPERVQPTNPSVPPPLLMSLPRLVCTILLILLYVLILAMCVYVH
ncbi:hypothetical protein LDENG_00177990 [Lucifuga dentata]|nr:hypothetical protein LDENG_00177990 [Lucifuga dentata]